ncbi:MAG TPA: DoxX family protein [Kofleriaceae bacterium]|nr:DoxX family protein [Kofleriaceae bacterium]
MTAHVSTLSAPLVAPSNRSRWIGRILTALPALFLAFSAIMKFAHPPEVTASMAHLGIPDSLTLVIGTLELGCVILYLIPRTSILGAVLLTGYLGGAVMTHLRVGDPLLSHTLFPIFIGIFVWGALYVRDARVRALVAPRT